MTEKSAPSPNRRFTDAESSGKTTTVIGQGIHVQGEITGSASIEVWGSVEGISGTEGLFWIREGGKVNGEIAATNVVVEGQVEGRITAEKKVELRPTCKVRGDVAAKTIAMAEGAFFEGRISMDGEGEPRRIYFKEKRQG